jgi:hypothetical protein
VQGKFPASKASLHGPIMQAFHQQKRGGFAFAIATALAV